MATRDNLKQSTNLEFEFIDAIKKGVFINNKANVEPNGNSKTKGD